MKSIANHPPVVCPRAANFHLVRECNERCRYCFCQFDDDAVFSRQKLGLPLEEATQVVTLLAAGGVDKITFVGGEPTLYPGLADLILHAKALGMTTSVVTNGARLRLLLDNAGDALDWVGLSIDSVDEGTQQALGRGRGRYVHRSRALIDVLRTQGIGVKLNTVVTSLNWQEDMREFVTSAKPERWKVLQVLPIAGQNDAAVAPLLITPDQFEEFVARNQLDRRHGISVVPEDNEAMTGSYAMIDPAGRFFSNVGGRYRYSSNRIVDIGVAAAFAEVAFFADRFAARGGDYQWRRPNETKPGAAVRDSGVGR